MHLKSAVLALLVCVSAPLMAQVADSTPPQIVALVPSATNLWPANKKMVSVTIDSLVIDDTDAAPFVHITGVTSSDQATSDDWSITGAMTLDLRADRSNGKERVYTIAIEAVDAAGNVSHATTQVSVKQESGKKTTF